VNTIALKRLALAASLSLASAFAGAAVLAEGDDNYVGYYTPATPSNPDDEVNNINGLIKLATGAGLQDCPDPANTGEQCSRVGSDLAPAGGFDAATTVGADKDETGDTTVILDGFFQYIIGKYDAGNAGTLVWYFENGVTGEITLPDEFMGHDLSHLSWYNVTDGGGDDDEIPEPGSLALLGLGLLVAAGARRRRVH
jgi:hypothetical protein